MLNNSFYKSLCKTLTHSFHKILKGRGITYAWITQQHRYTQDLWQTSRLTIHNLLYESKLKIHDYNIRCTYQFPSLNTAAVGAGAAAAAVAAVSDTDSVAGDQQFVLRSAVGC